MTKEKPIASLILRGVPEMTDKQKRAICEWLNKQSEVVWLEGDDIAKEYHARYWGKKK